MKQNTKFKQTEIGMIPEDWEVKEIREIVSKLGDGLHGTPKYEESGDYWFINGNNLVEGRIEVDEKTKRCSKEESEKYRKELNNRTIMISINGTLGNIALYNNEKIILGKSACYLNVKENFCLFYIKYILKNRSFQNYIQYNATGTTIKNVSLKQMREFKFGIPKNFDEQSAIAKILSDFDSKIELNQQMNKTLEAIGQAIFKRWFIDFEFPNEKGKPYKSSGGEMVDSEFGEIPKGWKVSKIGKEFETILGGTPSTTNKSYWENGIIPWINSGAINDFPIINASQHITEAGLNNSATQLMPKKTVVLPFVISINKNIRISITGIETSGNQSVLGIIENEKIPCEFIYYWVEKMKDDIYSWATGGAQQHINKNNIDNTLILIPNDDVINNFKKPLIPIFDKILNNSYEIQNLAQIRDSLLPRLMSGKIRVPVEVKT